MANDRLVPDIKTISHALEMFSDNSIKRYIPRIWLNFLNLLTVESKADELWSAPVFLMAKKSKTAIEVSAAHADSMPVLVECNHWRNYQIDVPR